MPRDGYQDLKEASRGGGEETELTSMIPVSNGLPPGSSVSRGRETKSPAAATGGMEGGKLGARKHQTTDMSLSAVSSGMLTSRLTRDTCTASPGRGRNARVAPPLPRRADFGEYYPDGGWGWIVCGAAFTVQFLAHGVHLAFGTMLAEMVATFHLPASHTVWLGSASLSLAHLLSPIIVAVSRRKSPRLLATVGGLITALGCLFLSFSSQYHQLLTSYTLILGLGSGVTLTAASVVVGSYFHKRRECAEMLMLSGSGVGMALVSTFIRQTVAVIKWMRGLQALTGLVLPLVAAAALYRSANIYHPRRRAILHLKNLRKTKKQQREFEDKPPYFDWSPLRMRSLQVLMLSCAQTALGTFTPFALLSVDAEAVLKPTEGVVLMVYLGVALAAGCVLFGLVVIRASLRCMVARQYLCQLTGLGAGICTLLLPLVDGFHGYVLYVWAYGLLYGGYTYSLKVYTYELASVKLSLRCWGYVGLAQALPILIGAPSSFYLNAATSLPAKSGYLFAGAAMVTGSLTLFFMPWASGHRSNHEVIQQAHFRTKTFDDDLVFYGMEISDDVSSRELNGQGPPTMSAGAAASPSLYRHQPLKRHKMAKVQLYSNVVRPPLGGIAEEDHWSDIEAMSPMSPTDKVTEFLLQSQSMLQSYGQLHNLDLPGVRLEINNQFAPGTSGEPTSVGGVSLGEGVEVAPPDGLSMVPGITDIKLEATISRTSPKRVYRGGGGGGGGNAAAAAAVVDGAAEGAGGAGGGSGNGGAIALHVPRSRSEPEIWQKQTSDEFSALPSKTKVTEKRLSVAKTFTCKQKTTPV